MKPTVELSPVDDNSMPFFRTCLQTAFTQAAQEAFPTFGEVIAPDRDIDESLAAQGAEALWIMHDGSRVGGAIVSGNERDKLLDFIFINPESQNLHLGLAAWQAIEARYPNAASWELVTPYHERRNIHFYVNKCGFAIVEYYNSRNPDPHYPAEDAGDYPGEDEGLFRFRKVMG